jgi:hypothetical protein
MTGHITVKENKALPTKASAASLKINFIQNISSNTTPNNV